MLVAVVLSEGHSNAVPNAAGDSVVKDLRDLVVAQELRIEWRSFDT